MGYTELKNWQAVFSDVNCLRVMMYLAKYNPNIQFREIRKKLCLNKEEMNITIGKLMGAQLLEVESESFTLRRPALIALDNFLSLTKGQ